LLSSLDFKKKIQNKYVRQVNVVNYDITMYLFIFSLE
jgi:hypothetical protein